MVLTAGANSNLCEHPQTGLSSTKEIRNLLEDREPWRAAIEDSRVTQSMQNQLFKSN